MRRTIRQNVAIAFATVGGLLGGMLIHEAFVLVVTLNGIRLLARKGRWIGR